MQTPHSSPEDVQRFMQKGKWLGNLECYTQMCWQLLSLICLLLQLKLTLNHSYESARLSFKIMVAFYLWTLCGNICAVTGTFHSNNALTFYNFATLNLTWSCACVCMCVCVCVCVCACMRVQIKTEKVRVFQWLNLHGWLELVPSQCIIARAHDDVIFTTIKILEYCWFHLTSSEGVSVKHQCLAGKYSTSTCCYSN